MSDGGELSDAVLKEVLRHALIDDGLARGLRETAKALDKNQALVCFLAKDCSEPAYARLITALCKERNVKLISVSGQKVLGEWCGLCKYDKDGNPRKVVKASCCAITNFGEQSEALAQLQEHLKN